MPVELVVPSVGESVTEVILGEWLKAEGDHVARDESLVELESDKATLQLPAPTPGRLTKILKRKGATAQVGEVIAYLEASEAQAPAKVDAPSGSARVLANAATGEVNAAAAKEEATTGRATEDAAVGSRVLANAAKGASNAGTGVTMTAPAPLVPSRIIADDDRSESRREEVVPMSPLRRKIAERLVWAQQTAALLTTFNEIDMSRAAGLRKEYQESFQERYKVKLGFMSFFVKAVIDALKQVPQLNAEVRETDIVFRDYYDIGVAVGTDKGLVVPVIRDADRLSFADIERLISDFGQRGRQNKLRLDELKGGTFTISNGGIYGSLLSTPIVNPPQSGILGLHMIEDRPVAREGQVVIRPMMYVALTYDHRVVDGKEAVTFLRRIKESIENPARLLLEI